MRWQIKAMIQNAVAWLPEPISYPVYYTIQRTVGGLRRVTPLRTLRSAHHIVTTLAQHGHDVHGATCFELGTGRQCGLPLGLWLCGAKQVITVDLNLYLREELVLADIRYIAQHSSQITELFGHYADHPVFQERLQYLCRLAPQTLQDVLRATNIHYFSPADARSVALLAGSIDYHVSVAVLEHIHPNILVSIITEARRLLQPRGLFVHGFDPKDHFATSDPSITAINFLQFDDETWHRYAGNRYMYHNRLRADDYLSLISQNGFDILHTDRTLDERSLRALEAGFPVHARFAHKTFEDLATGSMRVIARPSE